jgi:hypothetical protein
VKVIEENLEMIALAVLDPEEDRLIEQKLGIVTQLREVQNIGQIVNQKVDKQEFVTDLLIPGLIFNIVKRSKGR